MTPDKLSVSCPDTSAADRTDNTPLFRGVSAARCPVNTVRRVRKGITTK